MKAKWVKGQFDTSHPFSSEVRRAASGETFSGYGVHKNEYGSWVLTHLRTGGLVTQRLAKKTQCKALAELIESREPEFAKVGRWNSSKLPEPIRSRVGALIKDFMEGQS